MMAPPRTSKQVTDRLTRMPATDELPDAEQDINEQLVQALVCVAAHRQRVECVGLALQCIGRVVAVQRRLGQLASARRRQRLLDFRKLVEVARALGEDE